MILAAAPLFLWLLGGVAADIQTTVNLGTCGEFAILAKTAVSTTGTAVFTGHIGLSPAAASFYTGFSLITAADDTYSQSIYVSGYLYASDDSPPTPAKLSTAVSDMEIAYNDAAGRSNGPVQNLKAGAIESETLTPGLYNWGTTVHFENFLYLKGDGVFVLQIAQNLEVGNGAQVILQDGAKAKNIFWQVAGAAIVGTTAHIEGTILSKTNIDLKTGSSLNGAAYAQTAVMIDATTLVIETENSQGVTYPAPPGSTPGPDPGPDPGPAPGPAPGPPADEEGGGGCFSEVATVQVLGKGSVPMRDLQLEDHVFTGIKGQHEPIYSFGHRNPKEHAEFIQVHVHSKRDNGAKKAPLEVTAEHLVFLHDRANPVRADFIKVGDLLRAGQDGAAVAVTKIVSVERSGLYNPLTASGTLVVDGIAVSSYIALQDADQEYIQVGLADGSKLDLLSHENFVQLTLSPFRMMCMGVSSKLCNTFDAEGIPHYISLGMKLVKWIGGQSMLIQMIFLMLVFPVFVALFFLEKIFGAAFAPLVVFAAVGFFKCVGTIGTFSFKKVKSV